MKKRILMLLLAACLMMNLLPFGVLAEEVGETEAVLAPDAESGTCGDGLTWVLEDNTLTISGSGEMDDGAPWEAHAKKIEKLVLTGGVTKIGAEAFYDYDRLESIDFGSSLVEIGERAFYGCDDITILHLPSTFRSFGAECFRACNSLQRVYCDGGMPRFNSSCLWTDNYISIFYPSNNAWPQEYTSQLISNFSGRLGIMMGNYDDSVLSELDAPGEAVEASKPAPTEAAETEASTEAPTEAATEPAVTEPAIVLIIPTEAPVETTAEPTEEETEAPAETEAPTEPETEATEPMNLEEVAETLEGKSWIGLVMIAGVITFLLSGTMIFRAASKKGGRYRR